MNVCEAVVYSCTVPIVFTKSEYKNNLYIDGGFFDMCPLDKLVSLCGIQDKHILCLMYKNKFENTEIKSVFDYAKKVFSSIIKKYSMSFKSDKLDTVQINSDIQTLDFSMSVKDRIKFFTEGKKQAEEYDTMPLGYGRQGTLDSVKNNENIPETISNNSLTDCNQKINTDNTTNLFEKKIDITEKIEQNKID